MTAADVERLQRRFTKLAGPSGKVSIPQFQTLPELSANPFIGTPLCECGVRLVNVFVAMCKHVPLMKVYAQCSNIAVLLAIT